MVGPSIVKYTRASTFPCAIVERTSNKLAPRGPHTGRPKGQPTSTLKMSFDTMYRSASSSPMSQSLTGRLSAAVA